MALLQKAKTLINFYYFINFLKKNPLAAALKNNFI